MLCIVMDLLAKTIIMPPNIILNSEYLLHNQKEVFEVGRIAKFQLQQIMHPCKHGISTQRTLLRKTLPYWEACNTIVKYHNSVSRRLNYIIGAISAIDDL